MKKIPAFILSCAVSCSAMAQDLTVSSVPLLNLFELGVRQNQHDAYDSLALSNIEASVNGEPGTLAMYSIRHKNTAGAVYMIEVYADENAYRLHLNSPQYKNFIDRSPELLQEGKKRRIATVPKFLGDKKIKQTKDTINNLVIVDVKPEFAEAFSDVVLPEMAQSLKVEDGVLAMYAAVDKENLRRWYFYEIYASEAAYQAHRLTPHFKDYLKQTEQMTSYKETIPVLPAVLMNKGGMKFSAK